MAFKLLCALFVGVAVCDALPSPYKAQSTWEDFVNNLVSKYKKIGTEAATTKGASTEAPIFKGKEYLGASKYVIIDEKLSWDKASEYCENRGMILANPNKIQELREFIQDNDLLPKDSLDGYWIGGSHINGRIQWPSNEPIVSKIWLVGDPLSYLEGDCVELRYYYMLGCRFEYCDNQKQFICETIISNENEKNSQSVYKKYEKTTTTEAAIFKGKDYTGKSASRYVLSDEMLSWDRALENCENRGMMLASPSSPNKKQEFLEFINDNKLATKDPMIGGYWIGGHRVNQDYQWVSNRQIVTEGWLYGEPMESVPLDCVELQFDYSYIHTSSLKHTYEGIGDTYEYNTTGPRFPMGWVNNLCNFEMRFICETIISSENEKNTDRGRQSAYEKYPASLYPGFNVLQVPKTYAIENDMMVKRQGSKTALPEVTPTKDDKHPEEVTTSTSELNTESEPVLLNLPNNRLQPSVATDSPIDSLNQV